MAVAHTPGRHARPRGPAVLQVALAVGVAILLAAVTLTTRQSPPPAIAEFAPQAAEQIKEQPKEQSSQFGSGNGPGDCLPGAACAAGSGPGTGLGPAAKGTGNGGGATTTTSTPPSARKPTTKKCIGDPPRQIEDPQSPPCIASWDDSKGNGGATAPGVTGDTITIAAPDAGDSDGWYKAWQNFFNDRFEFYGRKVKFIGLSQSGAAGADEAKQRGAFASLSTYGNAPYYRELAHNKIIGVYRLSEYSDSELAANAPYMWSYQMSLTQLEVSLGDWACHRLVGFAATHAGQMDTQTMNGTTRKFAIFFALTQADSTAKPDVLVSALQQCGASVPFVDVYPIFDENPVRLRNEITQMKADGVTSAFCLCVGTNLVALQASAASQAYEPEWIVSNYPQLVQGEYNNAPPSQMNRTFGVAFAPMDRLMEDHPMVWALREGDPANGNTNVKGSNGPSDDIRYHAWLALMSGLQMAGPNLTPETFRAGLARTKFPNPEHPIMAGHVGFGSGTNMVQDGAEMWMSTTDAGPYDFAPGTNGTTFCFVDGGRRHARGTWPRGGDPFGNQPCDSGRKPVS